MDEMKLYQMAWAKVVPALQESYSSPTCAYVEHFSLLEEAVNLNVGRLLSKRPHLLEVFPHPRAGCWTL